MSSMSNSVNGADFILMCYLAPDYTFRIINTHPEYVGLQFHKAFRAIYKLPKFVDRDLHCTAEHAGKFIYGRLNTPNFNTNNVLEPIPFADI